MQARLLLPSGYDDRVNGLTNAHSHSAPSSSSLILPLELVGRWLLGSHNKQQQYHYHHPYYYYYYYYFILLLLVLLLLPLLLLLLLVLLVLALVLRPVHQY